MSAFSSSYIEESFASLPSVPSPSRIFTATAFRLPASSFARATRSLASKLSAALRNAAMPSLRSLIVLSSPRSSATRETLLNAFVAQQLCRFS